MNKNLSNTLTLQFASVWEQYATLFTYIIGITQDLDLDSATENRQFENERSVYDNSVRFVRIFQSTIRNYFQTSTDFRSLHCRTVRGKRKPTQPSFEGWKGHRRRIFFCSSDRILLSVWSCLFSNIRLCRDVGFGQD